MTEFEPPADGNLAPALLLRNSLPASQRPKEFRALSRFMIDFAARFSQVIAFDPPGRSRTCIWRWQLGQRSCPGRRGRGESHNGSPDTEGPAPQKVPAARIGRRSPLPPFSRTRRPLRTGRLHCDNRAFGPRLHLELFKLSRATAASAAAGAAGHSVPRSASGTGGRRAPVEIELIQ